MDKIKTPFDDVIAQIKDVFEMTLDESRDPYENPGEFVQRGYLRGIKRGFKVSLSTVERARNNWIAARPDKELSEKSDG